MRKILKIALPIAAIAAAVIVSVLLFVSRPEVEHQALNIKEPLVTVTTVQSESLSIPVFTRGTVTPGTEIQLISEVSGQVLELSPHFANGGFFRKGEVLVRVDPIEYEVNLKRAEANRAQAYQVKLQAEAEKKARSRVKNTSSALANYEVQYLQAKAQYDAAVAELEAVKMQKSRTLIKAPFDGRVRLAVLNVGQYVRPGQQMGVIYAVDVAEVRLPLSDRQLSLVDVPTRFQDLDTHEFPEVTLSEQFAGRTYTWKGEVVRAEGGVDERNRLLYVVAQVKDPYSDDPNQPGRPELVAGSFVEATIDGRKFEGIYQVPRKALRNGSQIWTVGSDNRLQERDVAIIYKSKDHVYVSSGLQDGEKVVLSQMDIAVNGMKVRTQQEENFNYESQPDEVKRFEDLDVSAPAPAKKQNIQIPSVDDPRVKEAAQQAKAYYDNLPEEQRTQAKQSAQNLLKEAGKLQQALSQKAEEKPPQEKAPQPEKPASKPVEKQVKEQAEPQPDIAAESGMSPLAAQLEADIKSEDEVKPKSKPSKMVISTVSAPKPLVESDR